MSDEIRTLLRTLLDEWKALHGRATTPLSTDTALIAIRRDAKTDLARVAVPRLLAAIEEVLAVERMPDYDQWDCGYNAALDNVMDLIRAELIGGDDD